MLILPEKDQQELLQQERKGIEDQFNVLLERILNENGSKDRYWILGKTITKQRMGKLIVKPFLQACDEKPGLVKESFVYEVDNKKGTKTLLWVIHPDGSMRLPTLNKTIRVAS